MAHSTRWPSPTVGESHTSPGSGALTGMTVVLLSEIDARLIARMSQQHRVIRSCRQHCKAGAGQGEPRTDRCARASSGLSELGACQARLERVSARRCRFSRYWPWRSARWPASPACSRSAPPASSSNRSGWRGTRPITTRSPGSSTAPPSSRRSTCGSSESDDAPLCILYLDLDGFKEINDTLGHQTGDELLICVGERIRAAIGHQGVLARLGGDEFALMLPARSRPSAPSASATRSRRPCAARFRSRARC